MTALDKPIRTRTSEMKIGNGTYIISCSFNENARETAEQKLMKLISSHIADELKNPETKLFSHAI